MHIRLLDNLEKTIYVMVVSFEEAPTNSNWKISQNPKKCISCQNSVSKTQFGKINTLWLGRLNSYLAFRRSLYYVFKCTKYDVNC